MAHRPSPERSIRSPSIALSVYGVRRAHPGAGEPARSRGADRLHLAHGRHRRHRLAHRRRGRRGAGCGGACQRRDPALGARARDRASDRAGRRRRSSRAAAVACRHRPAYRVGLSDSPRCSAPAASWRRAARRRRSSRSCGAPPGIATPLADPDRAVLSHRGLRALDPVRGAGAAARGVERLCHRETRQARRRGPASPPPARSTPPARSPRWRWR